MAKFEQVNEGLEKVIVLSESQYAQEVGRIREDAKWTSMYDKHDFEKRVREEGRVWGHEEGYAIGYANGSQEKGLEIAKKMLEANLPVATVAKCTELPVAEVEALIEKVAEVEDLVPNEQLAKTKIAEPEATCEALSEVK